jgi:hypothetical protein
MREGEGRGRIEGGGGKNTNSSVLLLYPSPNVTSFIFCIAAPAVWIILHQNKLKTQPKYLHNGVCNFFIPYISVL